MTRVVDLVDPDTRREARRRSAGVWALSLPDPRLSTEGLRRRRRLANAAAMADVAAAARRARASR